MGLKTIKCPFCGYIGKSSDFTYIYESVIYIFDDQVSKEERDRPVLVVCPRCGQGFFMKSPYSRFYGLE